MSPDSFRQQVITTGVYKNPRYLTQQTLCNRMLVARASEGIEHFYRLLMAKKKSRKAIHNNHWQLLKVFGIKNVSIHNVYLSEYMAAGLNAAYYEYPFALTGSPTVRF